MFNIIEPPSEKSMSNITHLNDIVSADDIKSIKYQTSSVANANAIVNAKLKITTMLAFALTLLLSFFR